MADALAELEDLYAGTATDGERSARQELLESLAQRGATTEQLREAVRDGTLTNERSFRLQFARVFAGPGHPLSREEAADQWSLIAHDGGARIMHRLIHYMDERERLTERWHGAFRDWLHPLHLAWGLCDPVATTAVLDGLRSLRPESPVTELPELGHYPQIDDPEAIATAVDALSATAAG